MKKFVIKKENYCLIFLFEGWFVCLLFCCLCYVERTETHVEAPGDVRNLNGC